MNTKLKVTLAFVALGIGMAFAQSVVRQGSGDQAVRPWYVIGVSTATDGGTATYIETSPEPCITASPNSITSVGVAAGAVPATAKAGRRYIEICNSIQNSGNPIIKCRSDGTNPVAAATNAGTVLGIGDCYQFNALSGTPISCISDTAATYATSFECL